ncbi:iron ABC transporter permease [Rhodococcus sp. H36-A4]|uniref:FecCD family ABC transporter permease n=1 Tax=Rhodococcus sp. H36-A4 TaxID=3004353 RepID=UPI0022AE9803|nr:iron ABC transporter permease [Rhodococcus sp. H36-A4]MCZ4077537.1 iron ABC transporter permease [Rhodococcus sp. H36-A4]
MNDFVVSDGRLRWWVPVALVVTLVISATACVAMGRFPLSLQEVFAAIGSRLGGDAVSPVLDSVVFGLRLPRIGLAIIVGAGLACAGAAFQSIFSNPLATPDTLGVTAGASVGAVLALVASLPMIGVQLVSLVGGLAAVAFTTAIARTNGRSNVVMLILSGVVVAAIANALLSILKYTADPNDKLPQITYWLMGSLAGASAQGLIVGGPLILFGVVIIVLLRWRLNILALSDDEARASGMNIRGTRGVIIVAATLITASCVSMCGQVGWVGLLIPHCARMLCGNNNRFVVPVSIFLGAIFLVVIDTLARTVSASEVPISVLTAVVGAPFFIVLLRRTGGKWV